MSLLTGLISYWKLDEASGSRADAHGSNTLTDNNTVGSTTGIINSGANFEQSAAEYLSCASNSDLQVGNLDFTLTCWVKMDTKYASSQQIVTKYLTGTHEYAILWNTDHFSFFAGGNSSTFENVPYGSSPSLGTWYFIVAWFDSSNQSLNLQVNDGTVASVTGISSPPATGSSEFQIGNRDGQTEYWDGLIDEVGFWKRLLTSGERTQLYNSGSGLPYSSFGGATVALTGVSATGAVGDLRPRDAGKILVVAGGGSGGIANGGGGGGGKVRYDPSYTLAAGSYGVTVGAGGSSSAGSDSVFGTITANGGGVGGSFSAGGTGGNGGGGSGRSSAPPNAGGSSNQSGFSGGAGGASFGGGGGGGGDSATGSVGTTDTGGAGGAGTSSSITGSAKTYGGGGGGAGFVTGGAGGSGGGGAGGTASSGTAGTANTGGGGGGTYDATSGADGGSGEVVVAYLTTSFTHTGGNSTGTDGAFTWVKFTASGTLTLASAGGGVSVGLTGVSASGSVGTLSPVVGDQSVALTGVSCTGYVGNLTPSGGEIVTATPGFIRGFYDYYNRRRREEEREPERELEPATDRAMREYAERSEVLTQAIDKLRAESAAIRAESEVLRERLERASSRKAVAQLDYEIMLKEQAAILAKAEESALLQEMELNDVMGVALIALAYVRQ